MQHIGKVIFVYLPTHSQPHSSKNHRFLCVQLHLILLISCGMLQRIYGDACPHRNNQCCNAEETLSVIQNLDFRHPTLI